MQFTTLFATLAVAAVSSAAPFASPFPPKAAEVAAHFNGTLTNGTIAEHAPFNGTLEKRQATGKASYYNTYYPTYSSCGEQPQDTDFIAAVSPAFMPAACGKTIAVTNENTGTTINVRIVDTCVACGGGAVAVDLTPTAFQATGASLDEGVFPAHWSYV